MENYKERDVWWILNELGDPDDTMDWAGQIIFLLKKGFDRVKVKRIMQDNIEKQGYSIHDKMRAK